MPRAPRLAVTLRRAEPEDFEGIWRTFLDEEIYSGTLQLPHPSRETWRKRCAEFGDQDFVLVACAGDEIIGHAGLHPATTRNAPRRAHAMWLGLVVRKDWHGKGVGRKLMQALVDLADGWLNIFRIELTVFTDNARAIALYRKFGFEVEGKHRAYALRAGRYADVYAMARLRPRSVRV